MNTGRNWTRRSIEELIDDFLKRRGTQPTSQAQYVNIRGKISEGNWGSAYAILGVIGASKIMDAVDDTFLRVNDLAATVDCRYSGTTPINLAYHCEKTYFPIAINLGSGFARSLDAIYYMPWTTTSTYQGTCYIITKSSSTPGSEPSIGTGESSYSFTGTFRPGHIHSIPTSATMSMSGTLAFRVGRNSEYLQAMQAIDTVIRNRITSPLGINTGTCILSEYAIPETEIQRKYPQITTFQRLTY